MEDFIVVIGCLGFTTLLITPFIVNKIIKFKLEIARINSETTIRAEEIRSKNQFELEKFLKQEETKKTETETGTDNYNSEELYDNPNRSRVRE
jgi:hypothetical protein